MILKSKAVKSKRGMKNVLRYIISGTNLQSNDFVLTRFIRGDRPFEALIGKSEGILERSLDVLENRVENMFTQFEQNNEKRRIKRKNANRIYHEIISFNKLDTDKLNSKNLKKLARYYAKIRSKNSLMVSALHSDKEHLHIHNVISAVEFETGKTVRLSRNDFKNVKVSLENWQEKNLGLIHSKVNHDKKKRTVTSHRC
ncbi:Relaxase/Mobilisation nuclease domain-containing protein [Lutibacter oricola]|uniref:Relaxase/Mobilisation nuclease domain-containing protein n=1 Tax=Lutibacter oricola TaxID=762486 RepID=A0A1H2WLL7_9FLAO|nr:relaxase/mobilization nuclease domain-containing protein [Lutibacter oricola]SDW81553.1 Relaxase/Mobilisation nuclease domain-containing protein [Lutibacter oricola]